MELLNITSLKACVAIVDGEGFNEAAKMLGVTQSAVSHQVTQLEKNLGREIFVRVDNRRQARLTSFGSELITEARALLNTLQDAQARLIRKRDDVVVGVTFMTADFVSLEVLNRLSGVFGAEATLRIAPYSSQLREMVGTGELDLAFLLNFDGSDDSANVGHVEYRWFASSAAQQPPPQPLPVVTYGDERCRVTALGLDSLAASGLSPKVASHTVGKAEACILARTGMGMVLLSSRNQEGGGLVERPDLPTIQPVAVKVVSREGLAVSNKRLVRELTQ